MLLQARETGICPVREELYAQCFDELIREVTINCAERGLLLLRVRDEMHMTIAAYQVSYAPIQPKLILIALLSNVNHMSLAWSLSSCMLQTLYESSIAFGMRKALRHGGPHWHS